MTEPLSVVPDAEPETVEAAGTFEFFGETFTRVAEVSQAALMDFALDATSSDDLDLMESLATMYRMAIEVCAPEERRRFRSLFRAKNGTPEDLIPVVALAFGVETDRPTGASSDSSDGRDVTPAKSGSSSTEAVAALFPGRPDKQAAVMQAVKSA